MKKKPTIDLVGVKIDLGAGTRGMSLGPDAIRGLGLLDKIRALDFHAQDLGNISPDMDNLPSLSGMRNYEAVRQTNERLHSIVLNSLESGAFPVVLGGDHSVAAGSASAVLQHYKKAGIIWIDAHGDFNDEDTSPTGNVHGMPLAALCGKGSAELRRLAPGDLYYEPENVCLVGLREVDKLERARLRASGVHVFSISDIDRYGMAEVIQRAIELAGNRTQGIHVSLDIDAVSPDFAPGVGTPVHSGLTVREAFLTAELLYESGKILSLDVVEVNPRFDDRYRTAELAGELVLSILGKTVY